MSQIQTTNRMDLIESRIDKSIAGKISVSQNRGMEINSLEQAMELAKLMAVAGSAIPKHLRGNPGACLAVALQGMEWGINPFAIANKSYEVNDRLGYESALYHSVVLRRAPISGRIRATYSGDGVTRICHLEATLTDGTGNVAYSSPEFGRIVVKNSPLWKGDPDQQLFYYSVRAFARRHFPDVMMGIYTNDELIEAGVVEGNGEAKRGVKQLMANVTKRPVSEGHTFVPEGDALAAAQAEPPTTQDPPTAGDGGTVDAPSRGAPAPDSEAPEHVPADSEVNAKLVRLHEALDDADGAKKNLLYKARRATGQNISRAVFEGALFKALQSRGIGDFAKTTFEQRLELWREIDAGKFPPAKNN